MAKLKGVDTKSTKTTNTPKPVAGMTNEAIESMKAYADMMEFIEHECEKVRQTPDVYIGRGGVEAPPTEAREIVQNSCDIIRKSTLPNSPIHIADMNVIFTINEATMEMEVEDHGSGIPFGLLDGIFSHTHSGSSYHKSKGDFGAGKNGCGAAVTNFLSNYFIVETYIEGLGGHRITYKKGFVDQPEHEIPAKECRIKQGTITRWQPDPTATGDYSELTWQVFYDLFVKIIPLTAIGTCLIFNAIDKAGKKYTFELKNTKGMYHLLDVLTKKAFVTPISISDIGESVHPTKLNKDGSAFVDSLGIDVLITYDAEMSDDAKVMGFANTSPSLGGTHIDGVMTGICKFFKDYMNKIFLANSKGKLEITDRDVRTGLCVIINAGHTSASYNAQAKEILDNKDMKPFAQKAILKGLDEWSKANPSDLNKVCKYLKEIGTLRMKQDNEKAKVAKNYETSALSGGYPAKYVKPNGTKGLELFLVEGNSALGTVKTARDPLRQGIYPLRGKSINNAMKYSRSEMMANAEVQAIVKILGIEPANPAAHKPCGDISKCKFEKIIFLADADYDGYHIRTLLFLFFLVYYPDLIKAGRVYACIPPLYAATVKGKTEYFADEISYLKYVQKSFCQKNTITTIDNKPLPAGEVTKLLYRTRHFVETFESVARNLSIHPELLEFIIQHRTDSAAKFNTAIKKFDQFMTCETWNGIKYIHGVYNYMVYNIYMDQYFESMTAGVIPVIDNEMKFFKLNGVQSSLYGLCKAFKDFSPEVDRFKGLGENDAKDLAETAVLPGSHRTLVQYTIEDYDKQVNDVRNVMSNTLVFLQTLPDECKADFS